jgi:hypothetical protein
VRKCAGDRIVAQNGAVGKKICSFFLNIHRLRAADWPSAEMGCITVAH